MLGAGCMKLTADKSMINEAVKHLTSVMAEKHIVCSCCYRDVKLQDHQGAQSEVLSAQHASLLNLNGAPVCLSMQVCIVRHRAYIAKPFHMLTGSLLCSCCMSPQQIGNTTNAATAGGGPRI